MAESNAHFGMKHCKMDQTRPGSYQCSQQHTPRIPSNVAGVLTATTVDFIYALAHQTKLTLSQRLKLQIMYHDNKDDSMMVAFQFYGARGKHKPQVLKFGRCFLLVCVCTLFGTLRILYKKHKKSKTIRNLHISLFPQCNIFNHFIMHIHSSLCICYFNRSKIGSNYKKFCSNQEIQEYYKKQSHRKQCCQKTGKTTGNKVQDFPSLYDTIRVVVYFRMLKIQYKPLNFQQPQFKIVDQKISTILNLNCFVQDRIE